MPALARLIEAGYSGYPVPMRIDEAVLAWMVSHWDESLEHSVVLYEEDTPVAFALFARRGDAAWIGGLGVVPERRRAGLARQAMHAVLARAHADGVRAVTLEVLESNPAAYALYRDLGFTDTRRLEVLRLPTANRAATMHGEWVPVDRGEFAAHATLEAAPWQRGDATLAHMLELGDPVRLLGVAHAGARGAVAVRVAQAQGALIQARGPADPRWWSEVLPPLAHACEVEGLRVLNAPSAGVLAEAFTRAGAVLDAAQTEMRRTFD